METKDINPGMAEKSTTCQVCACVQVQPQRSKIENLRSHYAEFVGKDIDTQCKRTKEKGTREDRVVPLKASRDVVSVLSWEKELY